MAQKITPAAIARMEEKLRTMKHLEKKQRRKDDTRKKILWGVVNLHFMERLKKLPQQRLAIAKELLPSMEVLTAKDAMFLASSFDGEVGDLFMKAAKRIQQKEKETTDEKN